MPAEHLPNWVPSLDQALAVCAESGLIVNVEIESSPLEMQALIALDVASIITEVPDAPDAPDVPDVLRRLVA